MINTVFRAALAAASLALLPAAALAQGSEQPPVGAPKPFQLPQTPQLQHSITVSPSLSSPMGWPDDAHFGPDQARHIDDGDRTWLADLTGAMMDEGAAGRSREDFATAIAGMGRSGNVGIGWNSPGSHHCAVA